MICVNGEDSIEIQKLLGYGIGTYEKLKYYYINFWKKILNNRSYIFYKEALQFLANYSYGDMNFYGNFNKELNKYLYTGKCDYFSDLDKEIFGINTTSEDLCNLIRKTVLILDNIFEKSPKTPFNFICYRYESRKADDKIFKMKKGDGYINNTFFWASLDPIHRFSHNEEKGILFICLIPEGYSGICWVNPKPIGYKIIKKEMDHYGGRTIAGTEFEFIFPRQCNWVVLDKKKVGNTVVFTIELVDDNIDGYLMERDIVNYVPRDEVVMRKNFVSENFFYIKKNNLLNDFSWAINVKLMIEKYIKGLDFTKREFNIIKNLMDHIKVAETKNGIKLIKPNIKINNIIRICGDYGKINLRGKIQIVIFPWTYYFYKLFLGDKKRILLNFPFYFYKGSNTNLRNIQMLSNFNKNLLYNKNKNDIYIRDTNIPLFIICNIDLKKMHKVICLDKDIEKSLRKYIFISNDYLKIKSKERIQLTDDCFYYCVKGEI